MPQPQLMNKPADKSLVTVANESRSLNSSQAVSIIQVESSEPNSRLYIFNHIAVAQSSKKHDVHNTGKDAEANYSRLSHKPKNDSVLPKQASTKQDINKNKIHPIKRLNRKFRKNGLNIIDSRFNAYFFYYIWKIEKSGGNAGKYHRYVKIMTALAKLYGTAADLFSPIAVLFSEFFKSDTDENIGFVRRAVSYLAPVGAIAFTAFSIINIAGYKPELELWVNGEKIGLVASRDVVARASTRSELNISAILGETYEFGGVINYKAVLVKNPEYIPEREVYNKLYGYSQGYIMSAYGLYIDGELVGATTKESDIDEALNQILGEIADKNADATVEFVNDIQIIRKDYAKKDVLTGDEFRNIVTYSASSATIEDSLQSQSQSQSQSDVFYNYSGGIEEAEAEEGGEVLLALDAGADAGSDSEAEEADTEINKFDNSDKAEETETATEPEVNIAAVAAAVSLSGEAVNTLPRGGINALAEANDNSIIAKLSRTSANASGLQYKKTRTESYLAEIPFEVQYVNSDQYLTGTETVQTNGSNGTNKITAEITYIGETETSRKIINVEVVTPSSPKVILVGTKPPPAANPTGSFIRPVKGSISDGYNATHRAIDIPAPHGTSVLAADGGTVIYAGLSGSYGNHVKIRHSNGYVTLYAHMSSISVKQGDKVFQGQELGKVGSTGRSTGNHLHFELIQNGVQINPSGHFKN